MGLFDIFKKPTKKEEIKIKVEEEVLNTSGWDAITEEVEKIYPEQKNPKHYGAILKWCFGGNDPLDGISVYDGGKYWHFVTYGLSELYDKETEDTEYSGYGMEFTFKLKKDLYEDEESEIKCVCGILQALARITFTKGEVFRPYEYVYTRQTQGIDVQMKSNITGFITVPDTDFQSIDTPNGKVDFVEFVGATDSELRAIYDGHITVKELYEKLGSDVTSYHREAVIQNSMDFPFTDAPNTTAFTCCHVLENNEPILYVSHDEDDGMWQFLCGKKHEENEARIVSLHSIYLKDKSVGALAEMPFGCCAERKDKNAEWIIANKR